MNGMQNFWLLLQHYKASGLDLSILWKAGCRWIALAHWVSHDMIWLICLLTSFPDRHVMRICATGAATVSHKWHLRQLPPGIPLADVGALTTSATETCSPAFLIRWDNFCHYLIILTLTDCCYSSWPSRLQLCLKLLFDHIKLYWQMTEMTEFILSPKGAWWFSVAPLIKILNGPKIF